MTSHLQPKPDGPKGQVLKAGLQKGGSSIPVMKTLLGCSKNDNVAQHIYQCHEWYGFDINIKNDYFKITGKIPADWEKWQSCKGKK